MVAGSIAEELALAVPAEMLWKAAFATGDESSLRNLFAGLSNVVVKIDGDGEPGSLYSLKFNTGTVTTLARLKSYLVLEEIFILRSVLQERGYAFLM